MIFVDTGAWFASVVPSDPDHMAAARWLSQNVEPLLTTDYVVDETLTLLQRRGEIVRARILGEQLFNNKLASVSYVTETDINNACKCSANSLIRSGALQTVPARLLSRN